VWRVALAMSGDKPARFSPAIGASFAKRKGSLRLLRLGMTALVLRPSSRWLVRRCRRPAARVEHNLNWATNILKLGH